MGTWRGSGCQWSRGSIQWLLSDMRTVRRRGVLSGGVHIDLEWRSSHWRVVWKRSRFWLVYRRFPLTADGEHLRKNFLLHKVALPCLPSIDGTDVPQSYQSYPNVVGMGQFGSAPVRNRRSRAGFPVV